MTTQSQNTIAVARRVDGFAVICEARYLPAEDGWECRVRCNHGRWIETRGPDEVGNDVWATVLDMIDLALDDARREAAFVAGPYSTAQCRRAP